MIRFACPGCHTAFRVPGDKAGKRTTCPACGQPFRVPGRKRIRDSARPEEAGKFPFLLAGCVVTLLAAVVAAGVAVYRPPAGQGAGPAAILPTVKAAPQSATADQATASTAEDGPSDPDLFETPPKNYRALPAAQQARLQQKYEPIYLDPTAADREHIAAANALLGLPRGSASLLKGLDVYEGRPEHRRRYRWCLLYLCVVQHDRDAAAPAGSEPQGIIPERHIPAMLQLVRDTDPAKNPDRAGQFFSTLTYLARHGEHAGPVLRTLREMEARFAGSDDAVAREIQDTIRGIEQRREKAEQTPGTTRAPARG
jgi:hypothetical protein